MSAKIILARIADSPLWLLDANRGRLLVECELPQRLPLNEQARFLCEAAKAVVLPQDRHCAAIWASAYVNALLNPLSRIFPIVCYAQASRPGTVYFRMSEVALATYLVPGAVILCGNRQYRVCISRTKGAAVLSIEGQGDMPEFELGLRSILQRGWSGFLVFQEHLLAGR